MDVFILIAKIYSLGYLFAFLLLWFDNMLIVKLGLDDYTASFRDAITFSFMSFAILLPWIFSRIPDLFTVTFKGSSTFSSQIFEWGWLNDRKTP